MSFSHPNLTLDPDIVSELQIAIVAACYNGDLVDKLIARTQAELLRHGLPATHVETSRVPGSNEIPFTINMMAEEGAFDAYIGLGLVIAGETIHDEVIAHSTANALHGISLNYLCPVINGILTVESQAQAMERIEGKADRGAEFARAALYLACMSEPYTPNESN